MKKMEPSISANLVGTYCGEMINSLDGSVLSVDVKIDELRERIVKVSFQLKKKEIVFRGLLRQSDDDVVMTIQEKATDSYILRGVDGYLYNKPSAHGGYVELLRGMFFNIGISHYCGAFQEFYFFGKVMKKNTKTKGLSLC